MLKVFVYGTLKPGKSNYQRYCVDKTISISVGVNDTTPVPAYTIGKLFALPMGYPAMIEGQGKVYGYLLAFANSEILLSLDDLEGYDPYASVTSNLYNRYLVEIFNCQHHSLGNAWTYFMSIDKVKSFQGIYLESGCWND
ncbi:MAG: gamma-glutamylcyclotransferase [Cyanobacteria bacterium P01_A01_bin.45]